MKRTIYAIGLLLFVSGCTSTDLDQPKHLETVPVSTLMPIDLSHTGMPLRAMVAQNGDYKVNAHWNDTFGRLELSDEQGMDLFVKEDTLSCASKKMEIESSIFIIDYFVNTDTLICYTTSLPDGSAKYSHFYGSFMIGGKPFTFENNPLVECTNTDINHMTEIITQMQLVEPIKR